MALGRAIVKVRHEAQLYKTLAKPTPHKPMTLSNAHRIRDWMLNHQIWNFKYVQKIWEVVITISLPTPMSFSNLCYIHWMDCFELWRLERAFHGAHLHHQIHFWSAQNRPICHLVFYPVATVLSVRRAWKQSITGRWQHHVVGDCLDLLCKLWASWNHKTWP